MEYVKGYFTVERNIEGATLREIESKLGFRPGRLAQGARVLVLSNQPLAGQFVYAGSTLFSDAKGLVEIEKRRNLSIPHAWLGQRLIKVVPLLRDGGDEVYPAATSPVEQWQLVVQVTAQEVSQLNGQRAYWRRK